jgi:hypothetical protein
MHIFLIFGFVTCTTEKIVIFGHQPPPKIKVNLSKIVYFW